MMAFRLKPISIGALALLIVAGSAGATELLQATLGDRALYAVQNDEDLYIGQIGEEPTKIEIPRGAGLYSLRQTADGWVAAGHVLDDLDRPDLLLIQKKDDQLEMLLPPTRGSARQRGQAVPLISDGRLEGISWVAGDRQADFQVFAATWDGNIWGDREPVSGIGPGSQLALTGAVLEDGSWLLVWTRFDGQDDETVFSRRVKGGWTSPARVHEDNEVPDITPTVVALEGGALAAWSWFDGSDYRLRTARYDGDRWIAGEVMRGKGGLFPSLVPGPMGVHLLYQTVVPETWTVVEVDALGILGRTATEVELRQDRPLMTSSSSGDLVLAWPSSSGTIDTSTSKALSWGPLP